MAKHLLVARQVQTAPEGDIHDGQGLILRVKSTSASWVYRYTVPGGRRREFGLGAADRTSVEAAGASLKRARKKADEARDQLDQGVDPIDAKRAQREAAKTAADAKAIAQQSAKLTLKAVAREYHEQVIEPSRTTKHAAQWIASLEQNIPDETWDRPIAEVTAP